MECVNDTYLAVWNSIPPNKPEFLFAYTAKICRNLALNRVEWERAAKRHAVVVELSEELSQCIPDPSASLEQPELAQLIAEFLKSLPKEKRSTTMLYCIVVLPLFTAFFSVRFSKIFRRLPNFSALFQ